MSTVAQVLGKEGWYADVIVYAISVKVIRDRNVLSLKWRSKDKLGHGIVNRHFPLLTIAVEQERPA